jgi:plastocyanin
MKLAASIVALVALALVTHTDGGNAVAATITVNIGDNWFCNSSQSTTPCPTTIRVGDTINWNWVGNLPHTTTACSNANYNVCGAAQGWDSGTMGNGGTFSRTFNTAGAFFYRCNVHTSMRGRIDVIAQDSDADGWSDAAEAVIGTNPNLKCGTNAWPADIDSDGFTDITDISALTGDFGDPAPAQAPARHNIAPDPPDGFVDITDVSRLTGLFGTACTP